MPWKVFREGSQYCVHKLSPDGGKGEKVACHDSQDGARSQARALYASENKEIDTLDQAEFDALIGLSDEDEDETKSFMPEVFMPVSGAVSFEELEDMEATAEATAELNELVGKFTTLASNAIYTEGNRRETLTKLVDEFMSRVESLDEEGYEEEEGEDKEFKEVWTTAYVNNLPDSSFLYIEPGGKKDADGKTIPRTLRHLPVKDATGKPDAAHVRNAAARAGQIKLRTGKRIPPAKAASLQRRAQKMLSGIKKEANWFDETVQKVVEKAREVLGIHTAEPESAVPEEKEGFFTWKEADGTYSWLARYSNKFRDDDNVPEIISSASHTKFVEKVDKGLAPLPELWMWHVKDWKIGQATAVAYDDSGWAIAIGKIDGDVAEQMSTTDIDWAVSHGMPEHTIVRDAQDPTVIIEHETREISPLPRWAAANKMTDFVILKGNEENQEDQMTIPQNKRQALIEGGLSPELLESLERKNAQDAAKAESEGIESKETDPVATEVVATETLVVEVPPAAETQEIAVEVAVEEETPAEAPITRQEIAEAIITTFAPLVEELKKEIADLSARLEDVQAERDREIIKSTPAASLSALLTNYRAVGSKEAALSEDDPLLAKGPVEKEHDVPQTFRVPFIDKMVKSQK